MIKKVRSNIKEFVNRNFVFIVYVVIPFVVVGLIYSILCKPLKEYVSSIKVDGIIIENSQYTKDMVFSPFVSSVILIFSLLVTIVTIKIINYFFDKNEQKFDVSYAEKIRSFVMILTVLLSAIAFFYSSAIPFEYWEYGINNMAKTGAYSSLEPIPTIRGGNLTTEMAPMFYQVIRCLANLIKQVEHLFALIISVVNALLIPLSIKCEKLKSKK